MYKKILLIGILITILGIAGYGCWKKISMVKVLGEAQITVYEKGKKKSLDPRSPYFKELQLACEEMLTSGKSLGLKSLPDLEEVRNKEWAIELTYAKPIKVHLNSGENIRLVQLLIPLTGNWSEIKLGGEFSQIGGFPEGTYVTIFALPPEKIPALEISAEYWFTPVATRKDIDRIKDILIQFNVKVPYQRFK